jgi:ribonuclease-3
MVHASTKKRTGTEHLKSYNGLSCEEALVRCQEALGYTFNDPQLLQAALTHASVANTRLESNERLEFLGDAVLGMVVCEELFRINPHALEGELTKIKSAVVSRRMCARVTRDLGLGEMLFLGKGMISRTSLPMSLLAAVFESLIAAVYLDSDFETVRAMILRQIRPVMDEMRRSHTHQNFKSQLQQYAQREMDKSPVYDVLDEQGPDHSKCFEVCARLGQQRFPSAWGPSKKEAEQLAAEKALIELGLATPSDIDVLEDDDEQ